MLFFNAINIIETLVLALTRQCLSGSPYPLTEVLGLAKTLFYKFQSMYDVQFLWLSIRRIEVRRYKSNCYISDTKYNVLLHFSLSVKAVTLIFISGRDLAISSTHEGKTGNVNGKTENCNCLLRVNKYKLDSVKQKDP